MHVRPEQLDEMTDDTGAGSAEPRLARLLDARNDTEPTIL